MTLTLFFLGVVIMIVGGYFSDKVFVLGAVITFVCLIPHFLWFRCPHCRKHLGRELYGYCPHCGEKIEE